MVSTIIKSQNMYKNIHLAGSVCSVTCHNILIKLPKGQLKQAGAYWHGGSRQPFNSTTLGLKLLPSNPIIFIYHSLSIWHV